MVHNAIPHHHHATQVEVCRYDEQSHECTTPTTDNWLPTNVTQHLLASCGHGSSSHHDACSFNPEFTFEFQKLLFTADETDTIQISCPLKLIESEYLVPVDDDALCRVNPAPNLLRGPPSIG